MLIDLNAFANYALDTFDYSEEFEDDAFAVTWEGARVYVERHRGHFTLEVGKQVFELPR